MLIKDMYNGVMILRETNWREDSFITIVYNLGLTLIPCVFSLVMVEFTTHILDKLPGKMFSAENVIA